MNVIIELCPLSSKMLSLVKDTADHPIGKSGLDYVVASDNPAFIRMDMLTHDLLELFLGLEDPSAGLPRLNELAIKSFDASGLTPDEKEKAINYRKERYVNVIEKIYEEFKDYAEEKDIEEIKQILLEFQGDPKRNERIPLPVKTSNAPVKTPPTEETSLPETV